MNCTAMTAENRVHRIVTQLHSTTVTPHHTSQHQFKYTVANRVLTLEQRKFYEDNGYILIRNVVPQADLDVYKQHFIDIANGTIERSPGMTVMRDIGLAKQKNIKGEHVITKVQDYNLDDTFFSYNCHKAVVPYIKDIIGDDLRAMHTMLINKPPDLGMGSSRHPPHQDLWYFPFRPAEKIACSWTAMQVINKENGCLFVVPGTHKGELKMHGYPNDGIVNKAYHGIHGLTEKDTESMLWVEMQPGDTLFFHPLLIHGSGRNNTTGYRKAISCHYANSAICDYIEVNGTMQEELSKEIMEMTAKKMGRDVAESMQYADLWRMKSRQVIGDEGKLA